MFLALRDLRFARGRFTLMGAVIALITLLVVLLSGLTAGLGAQSVSAITSLNADRIVFSAPADGDSASYGQSRLDESQLQKYADATTEKSTGVTAAAPIGIAQTSLEKGQKRVAISAFGVQPKGFVTPRGVGGNEVVISDALKDDGIRVGDEITIGNATFTVAGIRADSSYNHTPVVWMDLPQWQSLDAAGGATATVLALKTTGDYQVGPLEKSSHTVTETLDGSLGAVGSYSAENGSLTMIRVLLLGISAVVVGAFFTVWTIQRTPDIAVLKAVGASTKYVVKDAAAQAFIVLLIGGGIGALAASGLGLLAASVVPFVVDVSTTVVPLALLIALGMLGALAALKRISSVDPITALGAAR